MTRDDLALNEEVRDGPTGTPSVSPDGWQREVVCPITGKHVVAGRPGSRMVTSEEIYKILREDFP